MNSKLYKIRKFKSFFEQETLIKEILSLPDHFFVKKCVPFEKYLETTLNNFKIDLKNIDRLYLYTHNHDLKCISENNYNLECLVELYVRIEIKKMYIYLLLYYSRKL